MNNDLDKDTMIKALTDGIGARLGRPVRSSFYELASRLNREKDFVKLEHQTKQVVIDILALALFYNVVIAPLENASSLFSLLRNSDATHIRIGKDKLTPHIIHRFGRCVGFFKDILQSYKIPPDLLSFSTLKIFIKNVKLFLEKPHETLD
jgi:hypothetical protein